MDTALAYPGIQVVELTAEIAIESTRLPGEFHRDPADQIIVATARIKIKLNEKQGEGKTWIVHLYSSAVML